MAIGQVIEDPTKYQSMKSLTNNNTGVVENPKGVLDKDSFMQLLLVELQHQDPTEPMDSDKILTQTSQLATLESSENMNKSMQTLVDKMSKNMDMGALGAIGKMASLGSYAVTLPKTGSSKFEVYFEKEIKSGTLSIEDAKGNIVKSISLEEQAGESGVLAFEWDGTDNSDQRVEEGSYGVKVKYLDANNDIQETQFGIYPVESVRYQDGKPLIKLGSSYVPMDYIAEFF